MSDCQNSPELTPGNPFRMAVRDGCFLYFLLILLSFAIDKVTFGKVLRLEFTSGVIKKDDDWLRIQLDSNVPSAGYGRTKVKEFLGDGENMQIKSFENHILDGKVASLLAILPSCSLAKVATRRLRSTLCLNARGNLCSRSP
ncbi:hypothetical protein CEXT_705351 [Caerostris extrusa]|uniref:Uncharacterized protein n=1 Tax=Caerostris extrusa TaxID=172846 RepID=A0AAV4WBM4_CAEEX|nr:hypothetical protein CEXT_705351 [Caerostris extrusa]